MNAPGDSPSGSPGMLAPVGAYRPPRVGTLDSRPPDRALVAELAGLSGVSSAFSDQLDLLGVRSAVAATTLGPLRETDVLIGRALTLRYLPIRRTADGSRLAHLTAAATALTGDVLVIAAPRDLAASVLGGKAAAACVAAGLAGLIVDGAIRDVDEIDATGLRVWARARTPITGRGRLDAIEINGPVEVGGVAVVPGDVVVADRSGVVFVPADRFPTLARSVLSSPV